MQAVIGFDVYGTLVDPLGITNELRPLVGALADRFAELWREKQLEYSFRRALMRHYQPFTICTRQALVYTERRLGLSLAENARERLMDRYRALGAFPDAEPGLTAIRRLGSRMFAFSNGTAEAVRTVLESAGLMSFFDGIESCDSVRSFKPDPAVYAHFLERAGAAADHAWLVSSNPFDIIGAASSGLRTAWVKRGQAAFDPWDIEPEVTIANLEELASNPIFRE
ncbi:MAG: haloacid dehalogenase type II [Candidatus Binataceae bacterium]